MDPRPLAFPPAAGPLPHGRRGITLIEILMVLAMIGILAAVAIPRVATSSAPHAVLESARRIHSAVAEARARAIAEQRQYRFLLSTGEYELQRWVQGTGWVTHGAAHELPDGLTTTIGGAAGGAVVFAPHGRVDAPTAIVLEDDGHRQSIVILASGLVRWEGERL